MGTELGFETEQDCAGGCAKELTSSRQPRKGLEEELSCSPKVMPH